MLRFFIVAIGPLPCLYLAVGYHARTITALFLVTSLPRCSNYIIIFVHIPLILHISLRAWYPWYSCSSRRRVTPASLQTMAVCYRLRRHFYASLVDDFLLIEHWVELLADRHLLHRHLLFVGSKVLRHGCFQAFMLMAEGRRALLSACFSYFIYLYTEKFIYFRRAGFKAIAVATAPLGRQRWLPATATLLASHGQRQLLYLAAPTGCWVLADGYAYYACFIDGALYFVAIWFTARHYARCCMPCRCCYQLPLAASARGWSRRHKLSPPPFWWSDEYYSYIFISFHSLWEKPILLLILLDSFISKTYQPNVSKYAQTFDS